MLQVLPVIDIQAGQAVHAIGGVRKDYRPLRSNLRPGSDPIVIAQAVRDRFGLRNLYLADLDAIADAFPSLSLYEKLTDLGFNLWLDAGLTDGHHVAEILKSGVSRVIVGLETVTGPSGLSRIIELAGSAQVTFSLDLHNGRAILPDAASWGTQDPLEIARSAVAMGVNSIILLDLARVGTGQGVGTLPLLERLAKPFPNVDWIVGGGITSQSDLTAIENAGGSAALIGSALHDGRFGEDWME